MAPIPISYHYMVKFVTISAVLSLHPVQVHFVSKLLMTKCFCEQITDDEVVTELKRILS